jgi:site-specific DNA-methyltransferase (adenine-specific)
VHGPNAIVGRWPANVIFTHAPGCGDECAPGCPVAALDAQSGQLPVSRGGGNGYACSIFGTDTQKTRAKGVVGFGDTGGASRFFTVTEYGDDDDLPGVPFFYSAKASRSEREAGCGELPARSGAAAVDRAEGSAGLTPRAGAGRSAPEVRNHHPTVKPLAVMRWLCRLVTPPGGIVLDPFAGSGTTGVACVHEDFLFIGVEREAEYADIARARIARATNNRKAL